MIVIYIPKVGWIKKKHYEITLEDNLNSHNWYFDFEIEGEN